MCAPLHSPSFHRNTRSSSLCTCPLCGSLIRRYMLRQILDQQWYVRGGGGGVVLWLWCIRVWARPAITCICRGSKPVTLKPFGFCQTRNRWSNCTEELYGISIVSHLSDLFFSALSCSFMVKTCSNEETFEVMCYVCVMCWLDRVNIFISSLVKAHFSLILFVCF